MFTERVRGLQCHNCNGVLAQFRDRTDSMLRAGPARLSAVTRRWVGSLLSASHSEEPR
jgi:hypothetical protein